MEMMEVMKARHSVRQYKDQPLESSVKKGWKRRSRHATGKAIFIFSLLQMSPVHSTGLWHIMGNSAESRTTLP